MAALAEAGSAAERNLVGRWPGVGLRLTAGTSLPGEDALMNQLQSMINTVIASSVDRAARGAGRGDVAHGLLAGLRRIRTVVSAQAGYAAACSVNDSIHDQIMARSLETFGTKPVGLPPPGVGVSRATSIFEDAAMTCLTINAFFPGNTALTLATQLMTERLIEAVGGAPAWGEIRCALRCHETADDESASENQWTSLAIH